jgi:galactose mutarotase-like enzyme
LSEREAGLQWDDRSVIGTRTIDGFEALTIASADGGIEAAFVPAAGMICPSVRHRGAEVLGQRQGLGAYAGSRSTMGIPLLYPWANRLASARFELGGHEVDVAAADPPPKLDEQGLPIHGLLSAAAGWSVHRHATRDDGGLIEARFDFAPGGALTAGFPFPHRLALQATAVGQTLSIRVEVDACHGSPVPIAFGFHPYLTVQGVPRAEWRLRAPLAVRLELDDRGLPTGRREPAEPIDRPIGEESWDDAFLAPAAGRPFELSGGGRRISLAFGAGYDYAQLYAPADAELLAIEPMTAPANALIDGGDSLRMLPPGERFGAEFAITVADE